MKIPTIKDICRSFIVAIFFIVVGAIPPTMYFINVRKWPAMFSDSFFIITMSLIFMFAGISLLISSFILLKKVKKLNYLKQNESNTVYMEAEHKFCESQKNNAKKYSRLIVIALIIIFMFVVIYFNLK